MNPEQMLRFCQVVLLIGAILAAVGGYGAYHYKSALDRIERDERKRMDHKLDLLISQNNPLPSAKREEVIRLTESAESSWLTELKSEFDLGYALLHVDKEGWYYVPRNLSVRVDWFSTQIRAFSRDLIVIQIPSFRDAHENVFFGNAVVMDRRPGAMVRFMAFMGVEVIVECLETSGMATTMVIGFKAIPTQNGKPAGHEKP
jgi:hypothetical protein